LRIDYKQKVDELKQPWALRGFKLRCVRRCWYFSLVLHFIVFGPRLKSASNGKENSTFEYNDIRNFMLTLSENPSIRIINAIEKIETIKKGDSLCLTNKFLGLYDGYFNVINNSDARQSLDKLNFEDRYENATYLSLRDICADMHSTMADIVISLPDYHRRQAIEMFLL